MPSFIWIYVILNHIRSLFCHTKSEYIIWSLLRPYHKINTANESYELVLRSLYNSHGTGNGKHLRKHLLPLKKVSHMCLKQHEWWILIFGWTTPLTLVTMQKKSSVLFRQDHLFCLPQTVMAVTHSYPGHSCKSWTKGKHYSTNDSHGSQKHWQESSRAQAFSSGENKTVLVIINQRSAQRYLQLWCVLFCCGRMNI